MGKRKKRCSKMPKKTRMLCSVQPECIERKIPYRSTRRDKNMAFKYHSKVLLYVASSLSRNDAIDDFWMVSNPEGIERFDDIVLRMSLKNADPIVIFVKVIFTSKPVSFELLQKEQDTSCEDEFLIKLWEYREDFERFMDGKEQNELRDIFKDVDKDKHFFCIFTTSKAIDSELQTRPFGNDHIMELLDASVGKKARKCQIDNNTPFGKQLYIFLDQPDIDDIGSVQANILGKHLTTKHLNELETRINKYMFQGTNSCSLTKYNFDKLCLEVIVDDYILSGFPHVQKIDEQYIQLWMELYSGDEIINVDNYDKICPLLGYFLQQQIQRLTDTSFTWKTGLTDEIKEKIFDKYRNNEHVTYNEPRVTNIKELLILLWKVENMSLIIKPEHALNMVNILKVYKHLKKNNFIIFSGGEIYDNVIYNVGQISRESTLKKILEIELSIQGRPRLPLSDITFIRLVQESSAFLRATAESPVLQNIAISQLLQWTAEGNDRTIGQTIREQNKYYISRRFYEVTREKQLTEEELVDAMENRAKLFTIWGKPGMGKSEVLRSLTYKYSYRKMAVFVEIRPNLDFDDGTGFDLIKNCLDTKSDVLFNSIYDTYRKNSHIVLFVDKYDYIPQEYKDKMEKALHTILEKDKIPIFITTRIETEFPKIDKNNKITFNLLPFSDDDVDEYCKRHKIPTYKNNAILKHFEMSFWRNPLHLNIITNLIKSHHSPGNLQKSEICEELVRLKLAIYCELSNLKPDEMAIPFMDYHNNFALLCTFGEEFVISAKLMRRYEVKNIVKIIADKGLVTGTNSKNNVQFIHKTYADYFVANWLYKYKDEEESTDISNKLKKSEPNCDILNIFDELIRRETEQCNKQAHHQQQSFPLYVTSESGDLNENEKESTDISNKLKKSEPKCDILNIFDELIRRETEQCNKKAHHQQQGFPSSVPIQPVNEGLTYQRKVMTYAAATLSRDNTVRDFWLVSNPRGIRSFDDVVLRISYWTGETIAVFVYVKITKRTLFLELEEGGAKTRYFLPIKLWQYKKHTHEFMNIGKSEDNALRDVFNDVKADKHFFCIFTNSKEVQPYLEENDCHPILFMKNSKCHQFGDQFSPKYNDFFYKHLYLFLGQPNETDIDHELTRILGEHFTRRNINELDRRIKEYMFKENDVASLTKNTFDMICLETIVDEWVLDDFPELRAIDEQRIHLWIQLFFTEPSTNEVYNVHDFNKIRPLVGYFLQHLVRVKIDDKFSWDACGTVITKEKVRELMIRLWQEENIPLVIKPECTKNLLNVLNTYKHLRKRFMIFSNSDVTLETYVIINYVSQLTNESIRKNILEMKVSLQGREPVRLSDIVCITCAKVNKPKPARIGETIKKLDTITRLKKAVDNKTIDRKFTHTNLKSTGDSQIWEKITISKFLSWTEKLSNPNDLHIIGQVAEKPATDYIKRRCECKTTNLDIGSRLIKSSKHLHRQLYTEEYIITDFSYDICTITSEPGMGKTELLRSLANYCPPEKLVLCVNLRDCEEDLGKLDFEKQHGTDGLNYFLSKTNQNDDLFLTIFEIQRSNHSTFYFFLDGLDEICPEYRKKIATLIKNTLIEDKIRIVISTRSQAAEDLPKTDATLSLNLLPFDEEDISDYCKKRDVPMNYLTEKVEVSILGNPLYLNMITGIVKKYGTIDNFGSADIYKKIIELKHTLHYQKVDINHSTATKHLTADSINKHCKLALLDIFGKEFIFENGLALEDDINEILNFILEQNLGLVTTLKTTLNFHFLNKTYAEYLVGAWLYETLQKNRNKMFSIIYRTIVENSHYRGVCCMFNEISAEMKSHKAAILGYTKELSEMINNRDNSIYQVDQCGRTIAHILAWYGRFSEPHRNIYYKLKNSHIASIFRLRKDTVLNWTNRNFEEESCQLNTSTDEEFSLINNIETDDEIKVKTFFDEHPALLRKDIGIVAFHTAIIKERIDSVHVFLDLKADLLQTDTNGNNALHIACAIGNMHIIKLILAKISDVNATNSKGQTAVHLAAKCGYVITDHTSGEIDHLAEKYVNVLNLLFDNGANLEATDNDGWVAFHYAAHCGCLKIVKLLLEKYSTDINKVTTDGFTALNYACLAGHKHIAKYLLNRSADLNLVSKDGRSCLMNAASRGNLEIVKMLVQKGANVNQVNGNGFTALWKAWFRGHTDVVRCLLNNGANPNIGGKSELLYLIAAADEKYLEISKMLVDRGIDVNLKTNLGDTVLNLASYKGHSSKVEFLLDKGNPLESNEDDPVTDFPRFTPLHSAAEEGHIHIVNLLIDRGINVNIKSDFRDTALNLASCNGHSSIVEILLNKGGNPLESNIYGFAPLHYAAKNGHIEIVKLLINRGIDVNIKSDFGDTALNLASCNGHSSIVEILLNKGGNPLESNIYGFAPLHYAAKNGHIEIVKLLINRGIDVNIKSDFGDTALNLASCNGHSSIVEILLNKGGNPLESNIYGFAPLHYAAKNGHIEIVKLLINRGIDVNIKSDFGDTALNLASCNGHSSVVEILLNKGGNPLESDEFGSTPLHSAASEGHIEIVKLLVDIGIDVNLKTNLENTPLKLASIFGHSSIVEFLLDKGGDPLESDKDGITPLHSAANKGHIEIVKLLVDRGIDVNLKTNSGDTALKLACISGHSSIVEFLLDKGGDPLESDEDGFAPLHSAAEKGHIEIVKLLVDRGIDVNLKTNLENTPLKLASIFGHSSIVEFLLDKGGDPLESDKNGLTPLHSAANKGHIETVKLLVDRGIDVNLKNNFGKTALNLASISGYSSIVEFLLNKGGDPLESTKDGLTPLHSAANKGHIEIVKLLVDRGIDVNLKTNSGDTALKLASISGHSSIVEFLLDKGGDPLESDEDGFAPLHSAAEKGHIEIVKLLVDRGIDVNIKTNLGNTALNLASYSGHSRIVEFLLDKGCDPLKSDENGFTPLHSAANKGHIEIVTLLVEKGIDVNRKTIKGNTALSLATKRGHTRVVEFLTNTGADLALCDEDEDI